MNTKNAKNVTSGTTAQTHGNSNLLSVPEAAAKAKKTNQTIRRWIEDFGAGKKIGGRYVVYEEVLDQILKGNLVYENQGRPTKESKKKGC